MNMKNWKRISKSIWIVFFIAMLSMSVAADNKTDRETPHKKASAVTPLTAEQLKEYTGSYYSDELPATYILTAEKGKLYFKHRNAPRGALRFVGDDVFRSGYGKVSFHRGEGDRIISFYLDADRVRIQFIKE
jgi:hypothetical protein